MEEIDIKVCLKKKKTRTEGVLKNYRETDKNS